MCLSLRQPAALDDGFIGTRTASGDEVLPSWFRHPERSVGVCVGAKDPGATECLCEVMAYYKQEPRLEKQRKSYFTTIVEADHRIT